MKKLLFLIVCVFALTLISCEKKDDASSGSSSSSSKNIVGKWAIYFPGQGISQLCDYVEFKSNGDCWFYGAPNDKSASYEDGYVIGDFDWYIQGKYTYHYSAETSQIDIYNYFSSKVEWINNDEMCIPEDEWHCYRIKGFKK